MKSKDFLRSKGILSNDSHHFIIDFHDGREINLGDLLEEYAQQSQPSGMSAEEVKEIAENHFKNTTWLEGTQEQDTKFGFRIGYMKAMKDFTIQNPSTASPAGAAEGASEGISKIREVMNWISQCVDEDHDLEVSEIKMIWNDLSDAILLIKSTPHSGEGMAEALRLKWITLTEDMGRMLSGQRGVSIDKLNKVMNLVQEFVNTLPASLSSPGSGWVKVEDGLPEIPPPYFENGLKLTPLGCRVIVYDSVSKEVYEANYYDGHFDDNNPDITHWQPLPTPPGE